MTIPEKIANAILILIAIISVVFIIFAWTLGIKGCKEIKEHGLKSIIEEIWEGKKDVQ